MTLLVKTVAQEEAANTRSVIIIRPFFVRGNKNGTAWMDYDLGGIATNYLGLPPGDPYKLAYSMQIQIEALKNVFQVNASDDTFWKESLERAERLVEQAVADIETTPDAGERDRKMSRINKSFLAELKSLDADIKEYAKTTKQQLGEPGVGRRSRFGEQDTYSVRVNTEPSGGRVRVVRGLVWRVCEKKSCDKTRLNWRSLNVGGVEGLIGDYHYIAEWGDGNSDEDNIYIDRDQDRVFRPLRK